MHVLLHKHSNETYTALNEWRTKKNITGTSYNLDHKLHKSLPDKTPLYIIDINNDVNRIEGIGILYKCKIKRLYKYNIYPHRERNRYSYKTPFYMKRDALIELNNKSKLCIYFLEYVLFYGKKNYKRMEKRFVCFDINILLYAHCLYDNMREKNCVYCGKPNNYHICSNMKPNKCLLNYYKRYFEYLLVYFKTLRRRDKRIENKSTKIKAL